MRLLLVEDDPLLAAGIASGLRLDGYSVDHVGSAEHALAAVAVHDYALIVLDIGLPAMSGLDLLHQWRSSGLATPVLLLTARDTVADRVGGLDAGADDYLVKPFDLDELLARLRALARRAEGRATPLIRHGELVLDPAAQRCERAGVPVELTRREFGLLQRLLEHAGRVVTRAQLETALYGWGEEVESNALEVHIHHLRRKLGAALIRTVRGVGYSIDAPA